MEKLTSGSKSTCMVTKGKLTYLNLYLSEVKSQIKSGQMKSWQNRDHLWQNSTHRKIQLSFFQGYIYALIFQQCNAISEIIQSSFPNCSKLKFRRFGPKIFSELHAWAFERCGIHAPSKFLTCEEWLPDPTNTVFKQCYHSTVITYYLITYIFRDKISFTYQISAKGM